MIDVNTPDYRRAVLALSLGAFLVYCNLYLFQPLLPLMAEDFQVSAMQINWLMAAGTLGLAVALLPWAIRSETIGHYRVMMISLMLLPLVSLTVFLANGLPMLTLARAVTGASLAGFTAVAVAYMAEEFSPRALVMAVGAYISASSMGGIGGRLFGGMVSDFWSWQHAVAGMACLSTAGVLLVYRLLPKPKHSTPSAEHSLKAHARNIIRHTNSHELWFAMLAGGLNFALFVNVYSVMGFRLVAPPYSLPVSWTSMIFLCYLSGTVTSRLSGFWRQKYSATSGMILGTTVCALGVWVAAYESLTAMIAGLLLISSGAFLTHSLAYGWVSQKAITARATATALYLVHYYVGGSLGGFFLIACWEHSGWNGVLAGAMMICLLVYALCFSLKKHEITARKADQPLVAKTQ
ncbi:MAG: MFS transporter [Endozoicomonas sp.]